MGLEDELFPVCPHWLDEEMPVPAYFFQFPDLTICDGCNGLGVYEDSQGLIRVCNYYRNWIQAREKRARFPGTHQ